MEKKQLLLSVQVILITHLEIIEVIEAEKIFIKMYILFLKIFFTLGIDRQSKYL